MDSIKVTKKRLLTRIITSKNKNYESLTFKYWQQ